ncbi:MAG: helix-turn-helix domain-containing protein [Actinomycetota bacterium]|nr:helix-turn-helix domain-containing protein [Actinomycetota bacterium]MDP9474748.1 helix-turn-helix domain-containing protein [Actinomycetota bacterium]
MENPKVLMDTRIAKALTHPLRVRLLAALEGREASPNQLAKEIGAALGTVSYHVRTLHEMGLLELVREERQRGAVEHYYTAIEWSVPKDTWAALPVLMKRAVGSSVIAQIGNEVNAAAATGGFDDPSSAHLSRSTLKLDEQGARQLAEEVYALMERASIIEAEARERLDASGDGKGGDHELVLMLFGTDGRTG